MGGAITHPPLRPRSNKISSSHHHLHDGHRRAAFDSHPFLVDAVLEVRTHEQDFEDTYFEATVISLGDRNSGKIQVEYRNLLAPRSRSRLLTEYVDASCVRPPPPVEEVVWGFGPGDTVDALYQDGWWIGVVARVVVEGADSRYVVTFRKPPDEREFGLSELRVHWDWVNGSWVRPDMQSIAGMMFDVTKEVEVSFDREDGQDAWFPAIIHEHLDDGNYLVTYCGENKGPKTRTGQIIVDSLHLRPRPPLLKDKNFVLLGKVDAYFDSGWWSGLIRKKHRNSRYLVAFKQLSKEMVFHRSDLRPHMEWKDGKWFTSPQDVILSSDGGMDVHHTSENSSDPARTFSANNSSARENTSGKTASSLSTSGVDQVTPDFQKVPHMTPLTRKRRRSSDLRNACLKKLKEGPVLIEKQQETHDRTPQEMLSDSVSPVSTNNVEIPGKQCVKGDCSSYNPSRGKRTRREKNVAQKINSTPCDLKNRSAQLSQDENTQPYVGGMKSDVVDNTAKDVQNEHAVVICLPCAEMVVSKHGKSRGKKNHVNNKDKQKLPDYTNKTEETKLIELGELSERRKRGRPRKTPVEDNSNTKDDSNIISGAEVIGMDNSGNMTPDGDTSLSGPKDRKDVRTKRTSARKYEGKVVKESIQPEKSVSKRGRRSTIPLQVGDTFDASIGKSAKVNSTLEVNNVDSEVPSIELDDQPLSKWIEGRRIQSPSAVDGSRLSAVTVIEQSIENREKLGEVAAMLEEATEDPLETQIQISTELQNLSFSKTSLLWKTIESLDAFQILPQNPHFQPLENVKESMREGLAIGHMVNFARVVETICKLQIDVPKSTMGDILETLSELEMHGFDVGAMRVRMADLIAVKDKEAELVSQVGGLNREISGYQLEKCEMEKEIEKLKEQIRQLQEKLTQVELTKEGKEDEIESVGVQLRETKQGIENLRLEFDGIAAAAMLT